jgi:hypothetical protein
MSHFADVPAGSCVLQVTERGNIRLGTVAQLTVAE